MSTIQFKGFQAALRKTSALTNAVVNEQKKAIQKALLRVEGAAKVNVRDMTRKRKKSDLGGNNLSGRLRNSVSHRLTGTKSGEVGAIGGQAFYAPFFEFGTSVRGRQGEAQYPEYDKAPDNLRPSGQPIKPKNGPFLVWEDVESGELVFAKQTYGQAPKPFLRKAWHENKDKVIDDLMAMNEKLALSAIK